MPLKIIPARKERDWRKFVGSLCVALIGLAALLGLEYAAFRLQPMTLVAGIPFLVLYGLIVWGMIRGLAGPNISVAPVSNR